VDVVKATKYTENTESTAFAGTMCCRPVLIQVILMSIIFEHFKQLSRLATEKIKT
jgi:hypothetical protein